MRKQRGRPNKTVTKGRCPKCACLVRTPTATTQCGCGQWVRNREMWLGTNTWLIPRRGPNKKPKLTSEDVA